MDGAHDDRDPPPSRDHDVPWRRRHRRLHLARGCRVRGDAAVDEGAARADDLVPPRPSGLRGHPASGGGDHRRCLDVVRRAHAGRRHVLRAQAPAAQAAAIPRRARQPWRTHPPSEPSSIRTSSTRAARRRSTGSCRRRMDAWSRCRCPRTVPRTGRCTCSRCRRARSSTSDPRITMMGGSIAWRGDSGGFWYTRYPAPDERPQEDLVFFQEVWFHELGTTEDRCDLAGVFADERIAENVAVVFARRPLGHGPGPTRRRRRMGGVRSRAGLTGHGGRSRRSRTAPWTLCSVATNSSSSRARMRRMARSSGSRSMVPRQVADGREIVPESTLAIEGLAATNDRLWVLDMDGGSPASAATSWTGPRSRRSISRPSARSMRSCTPGTIASRTPVETFVEPRAWWVAVDEDASPRRTALTTSTPLDLSGLEVRRDVRDIEGRTRVPISLIARRGVRSTPARPPRC